MFGLFGDEKTKLQRQYNKLSDEAYKLSHTDRQASDRKQAEAAEVLKRLEALESNGANSQ